MCQDESKFSFANFPSEVRMVLSRDGRFAAAAGGNFVKLLDFAHGRELDTFAVTNSAGDISALTFSPAATNVLATASGKMLNLWNLTDRQVTATILLSNPAVALAISQDGKLLASVGGHERSVELWRLSDCSLVWADKTPSSVFAVLFVPNGRSLISGGGTLAQPLLWDMATGTHSSFPAERQGWINTMSLSPDSQVLATGSSDSAVILWDLAQLKLLARLVRPGATAVSSTAFSSDGRWLVTGCEDSTVRLWDVAAREPKAMYG